MLSWENVKNLGGFSGWAELFTRKMEKQQWPWRENAGFFPSNLTVSQGLLRAGMGELTKLFLKNCGQELLECQESKSHLWLVQPSPGGDKENIDLLGKREVFAFLERVFGWIFLSAEGQSLSTPPSFKIRKLKFIFKARSYAYISGPWGQGFLIWATSRGMNFSLCMELKPIFLKVVEAEKFWSGRGHKQLLLS